MRKGKLCPFNWSESGFIQILEVCYSMGSMAVTSGLHEGRRNLPFIVSHIISGQEVPKSKFTNFDIWGSRDIPRALVKGKM